MRLTLIPAFLATITVVVAAEPWPEATDHVLGGTEKFIALPNYNVRYHIPDDPEIQKAGGSGGRMATIEVHDNSKKMIASLTAQSIGGRILRDYRGFPQFEIWGRAGGGFWCRSLYRHEGKEYVRIRTDEFTDFIGFARDKTVTTTMPEEKEVLYFVETRYPEEN